MALQGLEESFMKGAPGAISTPSVIPRCISIFQVSLISRTLIHKKKPPLGMVKSTKPIKYILVYFFIFFI